MNYLSAADIRRERVLYLKNMQPESLLVRCGRWRITALEDMCSASLHFDLWYCSRGQDDNWRPDAEWVVRKRILDEQLVHSHPAVFEHDAKQWLRDAERSIEAVYES